MADRYVVDQALAEGGMASIWLATDTHTSTQVAIKCLYSHYEDNTIVRQRFIDEGRIQMMLQHPNIVRVYELLEDPVLAFVMEYVDGGTLEEYLQERGPLGVSEILEVMIPVMSALGMSHSRGIVHRDLKPSNILVRRAGGVMHPKVMDFGVAKLSRDRSLTATGTTVGTLHYMSPEQIVGSKSIDGRADIYSLGITLYKLCTGEVPFNASTEFALMMAQVEAQPTPPSRLNPKLDPELEAIILKALRKRPQERYQTVKEFTSALFELRDEDGNETIETMRVPAFLLEFAMQADEVAVDKTEEIVLQSRELYDSAALETRRIRQEKASGDDTKRDLLAVDTQATTTERLDPELLPDIELFDNGSTMEVDVNIMEQLREHDASQRSEASSEQLSSEQIRELMFSTDSDDLTTTEHMPLDEARTTPMEPVAAVSDVSETLPRRKPRHTPPAMRRPPPRKGAPPRREVEEDSHDQVQTWRLSSIEREAVEDDPPRVFGPSFVDTGERTQPRASKDDFAGIIRSGELELDLSPHRREFPVQRARPLDLTTTMDVAEDESLSRRARKQRAPRQDEIVGIDAELAAVNGSRRVWMMAGVVGLLLVMIVVVVMVVLSIF